MDESQKKIAAEIDLLQRELETLQTVQLESNRSRKIFQPLTLARMQEFAEAACCEDSKFASFGFAEEREDAHNMELENLAMGVSPSMAIYQCALLRC
jgi:hypothetical protein